MINPINQVRIIVCVGLLLLIALTWRLWTPLDLYPRIPLLRIALAVPASVDWLALALLAATIVIAIPTSLRRYHRGAMGIAVISLAALFLTDQHRLQPWAFQLFWMLIAILLCREVIAMRLMRVLMISIYLFSGISKLDFQFVHTTGREFLGGMAGFAGQSIDLWPEWLKIVAALSLPVCESAIALALPFSRTRRWAAGCAILMHLVLIVLLSPLGLNHQPGVLMWNFTSAMLVASLFWNLPESENNTEAHRHHHPLQPPAVVLITVVSCAPVLEPFGWYDHWLAWGLYAPHNSRIRMLIHEQAADELPESLRPHVQPIAEDSPWRQVNLDRWSIDRLAVPIYPQARFQAGAAFAVLQHSATSSGFRIEIQSDSNRLTGKRSVRQITDLDRLRMQLDRFAFNAIPRPGR